MVDLQIRELAPGVHVADAPQRFLGLELGTRMTVLDTGDGLLVHSPIAVEPASLRDLGQVRWVLAPNLYHHLYLGHWIDVDCQIWGVRGLPEKRPDIRFTGVVDSREPRFGPDIDLYPLRCFEMTNEVVVLHRPSRTLVVTDLVMNFSSRAPWRTRAALWTLGGYPGCRTTILERRGMNRGVACKEIGEIVQWDFDRLTMAHGEVVETGGKDRFLQAFQWLLPAR
ncbi:MAG: hypothetical protein B7733_03210 [Myxococcales bacterium FL481]|nr:MAG: hypothetical protein B7733_03210 [Myxococcales bacterium FL481]